jgi:predicted house-cleaning NTP pyrophosphatase (Maf/HAM1 superfamily)
MDFKGKTLSKSSQPQEALGCLSHLRHTLEKAEVVTAAVVAKDCQRNYFKGKEERNFGRHWNCSVS